MARFDELPDQIIIKIFSYISLNIIAFRIRNVCTRWRALSDCEHLWKDYVFFPHEASSEEYIIGSFQHYHMMRNFKYYGTCNVIDKLTQFCTKLLTLEVPYITLSAADLKLVIERLTQLRELYVTLNTTEEGLEITRVIGQCKSLVTLQLRSYREKTVKEGLLKPIADGCPNLNRLSTESFNCPSSEICYLMQCKKKQLTSYGHYGSVSADLVKAMNECQNLKRIAFVGVTFDGPFKEIPPITLLQKFSVLELSRCRFPMLKIIPLTLFLSTLSRVKYVGITFALTRIDDLVRKLLINCPLMAHLDLEGNDELHSRGLRNLHCCKMLTHLDISYCQELGSKALKYVADGCPNLQHLDVSGNSIPNRVFQQILRCRNLKSLYMKDCDLGCINPKLMSKKIPGLSQLYIGPNFNLRDEVKSELQQQMPNLTITRASAENATKEYTYLKCQYVSKFQ